MRRLLPLLPAFVLGSTPPAQQGVVTAPRLTQAIELADGSAVAIRYRATPWKEGELNPSIATVDVTRGIKIGSQVVPEGTYSLGLGRSAKDEPHLVLNGRLHSTAFHLRTRKEHARRLEIVLTAGDQDGHGVIRFAFGDHTCRLAITAADQKALDQAVNDQRVALAQRDIHEIYSAVKRFMVKNPGPVPDWSFLITKDENGRRYVDAKEPKKDPWGHTYVVMQDPLHPNKPLVVSWGRDGRAGTADDISSDSTIRRKKR